MSLVGLVNRDQLDPVTASELDDLIPRVIAATLARTSVAALTDYVPWTNIPYSSGNFIQKTGTWTVDRADVKVFKYMVLGNTMFLQLSVIQTTLSGVTQNLRVVVPGGRIAVHTDNNLACVGTFIWSNSGGTTTHVDPTSDNPKATMGSVFVGAGGTFLSLIRNDATASVGAGFADGMNSYNVAFSVQIELQPLT